jgi:hypothetical protein
MISLTAPLSSTIFILTFNRSTLNTTCVAAMIYVGAFNALTMFAFIRRRYDTALIHFIMGVKFHTRVCK